MPMLAVNRRVGKQRKVLYQNRNVIENCHQISEFAPAERGEESTCPGVLYKAPEAVFAIMLFT